MKKDKVNKLTDQAFLRLIITSVLAIVVCLVCLCSTTWAWYNENESSASNSIQAASCKLQITVDDGIDGNEDIDSSFDDGAIENLQLTPNVVYKVKLEIPDDSASGYCIIKLNGSDETKVYSQSVSNNGSLHRELEFEIIAEENVSISIIPCWGIYSGNVGILDGDVITVSSLGFSSSADEAISDETVSEDSSEFDSETAVDSESVSETETDSVIETTEEIIE